MRKYDTIIIGSGAAGLAAALYAGRYLLKTLVIGRDFGGETATAGKIWNYPGAPSVEGYDLMVKMREQAKATGATILEGKVVDLQKQGDDFLATTEKESFLGQTMIFAFGAQRRHLGLPREKELTSRGLHYCVTCDGPLFTGKTVAMIGGGDSSVKGINFLADYAKKIYFIVRDNIVRAEPINFEQMKKLGNKVELLLATEVKALRGERRLEKVVLSKPYQGSDELILDGLFVEIGFSPNRDLPQKLAVALDESGYIKVDNAMTTSVPGVFAAGDCTNFFGRFKQDITAAAMGAVAATAAYEYLKK